MISTTTWHKAEKAGLTTIMNSMSHTAEKVDMSLLTLQFLTNDHKGLESVKK